MRTWVGSAILGLSLLGVSCGHADFRDDARRIASAEHRCPVRKVHVASVVSEDRMRSSWAYWLDVCGSERLYKMDATTAGLWVDGTNATR